MNSSKEESPGCKKTLDIYIGIFFYSSNGGPTTPCCLSNHAFEFVGGKHANIHLLAGPLINTFPLVTSLLLLDVRVRQTICCKFLLSMSSDSWNQVSLKRFVPAPLIPNRRKRKYKRDDRQQRACWLHEPNFFFSLAFGQFLPP
jgi:hypothetical protein